MFFIFVKVRLNILIKCYKMFSIIKFIKSQSPFLASCLFKPPIFHFGKGKRVRQLSQVKITLPTQQPQQVMTIEKVDYVTMKEKLRQLSWEQMQFDKLCSLPEETLALINMEIKKDKFNIDDSEFYEFSMKEFHIKQENNATIVQRLNIYYRKLYHLLTNNHQLYSELVQPNYAKSYYTAEMYIMDLKKNIKLKNVIQYFINNIDRPNKLELIAEPSFIKHLLSIKRQLIMQGVHFQSIKDQKIKRKLHKQHFKKKNDKKQDSEQQSQFIEQASEDIEEFPLQQEGLDQLQLQNIQENQEIKSKFDAFITEELKQCKHKIKILKVLGYEYEFWVDVKHNRSKNGVEEDYIIEQRQIQNPNESILVKQKYPKIKVRYIVHKKKRKNHTMHFCIKANLLIEVSGTYKKLKVQWRGPSSSNKENSEQVSFIVIDYEHIMKGNPTIKPIFYF